MVPLNVRGERPGGQQAGGQVGFPELVGQAQALFDDQQRGARLPLAQQDGCAYSQQLGDQVVVPGGAGDDQRFLAVVRGDRVAARLLKEAGRCG